jgi:hypothetical protein
MLPHEKALVERLKDEPFALIGVNSDGKAEVVREKLAKEGITWRQAIDVTSSGPWASKWNVQGWPTIYVVDAKGVIRNRGYLSSEEIDKAVEQLLAEAKKQG